MWVGMDCYPSVTPSGLSHPCLCHQSQLYCATQRRNRACFLRCSCKGEGQLPHLWKVVRAEGRHLSSWGWLTHNSATGLALLRFPGEVQGLFPGVLYLVWGRGIVPSPITSGPALPTLSGVDWGEGISP